jgi:molybdopterin molybdotransferase
VLEEVLAGQVPSRPLGPGQATRIMTGAMLPDGADLVVPVEQTRTLNADRSQVEIATGGLPAGKNILRRAESTPRGTTVIPAGRLIRAVEVGCLAELGKSSVRVIRSPRVGVLATGDELVAVSERPGPGQIRNSNEPMLVAQLRQAGSQAFSLGVARDNVADLRRLVQRGLEYDVLVLSGGVSAGQVDLVPTVLAECGVQPVFHKIQLRPGQPLWFGVLERNRPATERLSPPGTGSTRERCLVFGLPGNPVSSLVCCELFVKTALRGLAGLGATPPAPTWAKLTAPHTNGGSRPTWHPAVLAFTPTGPEVATVPWVGSADLSATARANAMIGFEQPGQHYPAGTWVPVLAW